MKKVRIVLSTFAVVLALGATFAFTPINPVYEFKDFPGTVDDFCESKQVTCQLTETIYPCRMVANGAILREHEDASTQCGRPLWRTTQPPTN